MTLDEQVLACARVNGYTNKNYGDECLLYFCTYPSIESQLKYNEIEIKRPNYSFENGAVYFKDPGHWEIYNHVRHYQFVVTDYQLKQWQRNYKLKEIGID
jgi:hypothetical protein